MTTKQRSAGIVALALIAILAFGAGLRVGGDRAQPQIYVGDGYVGADQASLQVGDTYYGFNSSVSWTDSGGSFHDRGWPACLPKVQEVKGVRFAGAVIWAGGFGLSSVVWVDCQSFHG